MTGENGNMYMPVAPAYGGGGYGGNGMFGDGAWWIIILLLFGWGGRGFGFGGGNGNGYSEIQQGFDQNAIMNGLAGIQGQLNANQIASMQQGFNMQSSFQDCCCENRLASAAINTTIAQEAAATRAAGSANTQAVLDKLCQLELDGVKQNYEGQLRVLQNQLAQATADNQSLRFAASQGAQTAQILANNEAQTTALEQYLAPVPRPAYIVQNPNCCGQNFGCGCNGYAG